ncbi:MAG: LegC family aminotransferase [Methylococcaceae bacterium]
MTSVLPQLVIQAIGNTIGLSPSPLHEPRFKGNEWAYVKECLDSAWVSSVGGFVDRFESDLARVTGSRYAIAVVNGTAALHIAMKLAGVQTGDEVIVPALSFIATANAISYCGAIPHFVDSEMATFGIDPYALREYLQRIVIRKNNQSINRETNRVIRAVVPVHVLGHPVRIDELVKVAHEFNLIIIEDAAESLGSRWKGQHTGTFGLFGTLSFNGNKTITTGGGGAILTNDESLAQKAKHLTTTAKLPHPWEFDHDDIGYNYRLPNLNAALGCAQLESLPEILKSKRHLHSVYSKAFEGISEITLWSEAIEAESNYWLQTLILDETESHQRDTILLAANKAGFMSRPLWKLTPQLTPYSGCPKAPLPIAEALLRRVINIPSSAYLA